MHPRSKLRLKMYALENSRILMKLVTCFIRSTFPFLFFSNSCTVKFKGFLYLDLHVRTRAILNQTEFSTPQFLTYLYDYITHGKESINIIDYLDFIKDSYIFDLKQFKMIYVKCYWLMVVTIMRSIQSLFNFTFEFIKIFKLTFWSDN